MIRLIVIVLLTLLITTACGTRERMVYFQNEAQNKAEDSLGINASYTPVFKPDDFISVVVTAEDPETAVPFNFPIEFSNQGVAGGGYQSGRPAQIGYLVDEEGYVELPVLGKIMVGGKSRRDVKEELKQQYNKFLNGPVVNIQIQNFKVTVLGDVQSPGTFQIPNERITIIEAIGIAGDLKMTGERKNVLVLRDRNGEKSEYRVDITSKEVLNSSVYYLEQNDVVYVEPNAASRSTGTFWRTSGGIFISLTSLIITTVVLITR